ncbi:MAG TPA: hypothetical protein PLI68_14680 [Bacteroidia bacterium]|nr:hypothetical protein [Bacteroidia bacterium]
MKIRIRICLNLFCFMIFNFYSVFAQDLTIAKNLKLEYEKDSCRNDSLFKKAESMLLDILLVDSNNIEANYSLAHLYKGKALRKALIIKENKNNWSEEKVSEEISISRQILAKGRPYLIRYRRLTGLNND